MGFRAAQLPFILVVACMNAPPASNNSCSTSRRTWVYSFAGPVHCACLLPMLRLVPSCWVSGMAGSAHARGAVLVLLLTAAFASHFRVVRIAEPPCPLLWPGRWRRPQKALPIVQGCSMGIKGPTRWVGLGSAGDPAGFGRLRRTPNVRRAFLCVTHSVSLARLLSYEA